MVELKRKLYWSGVNAKYKEIILDILLIIVKCVGLGSGQVLRILLYLKVFSYFSQWCVGGNQNSFVCLLPLGPELSMAFCVTVSFKGIV